LARLASRWSVSARPVRGVLRLLTHARNPFFVQMTIIVNLPF
jgi:hypothetical protein